MGIKKRIIEKYDREKLNLCRKIFQLKIKISGNTRPSSEPYISGDSFRSHADYIFDEINENSTIPNNKKGDIIFVRICAIENFFKHIHHKIKNPYILITHNEDGSVNKNLTKYIDEKMIHWYGQNVLIEHPKITPIPIGLENYHKYGGGVLSTFNKLRKKSKRVNKKNKIIYRFKIATNPIQRQKAYNYLQKYPLAEEIETKLSSYRYFQRIIQYKFTASPPGNGEECHRTWEALYLRVVPIVLNSVGISHFKKIGLPIWVINSWSELDNLTEKDLEDRYNQIIGKANLEPLWFDYWWNIIKEKQNGNNN